ncbi:HI0074 family nucleotidyltransferase substrate-binding subunit [soil metagenome]
MERLTVRFEAAHKSVNRLGEDIELLETQKKFHRQFRNSAIQSFEFSMDTFWKFIKEYLEIKYIVTIPTPSPRSVFREATNLNVLTKSELQLLNKLVADRNLTSHTYNESLAEEIAQRLPEYYQIMQSILQRIRL